MINGEDVKSNITKNIIKYREKAGLSQKELAKELNISPSRISNWEQGSNCPNIEILFEVCRILNVSINDIYGVYPDSDMTLSYTEQEHIRKYRIISTHSPDGATVVDTVLDREYAIADKLRGQKEQLEKVQKMDMEVPGEIVPLRLWAYYRKIACAGTGFYFDDIPTDTIEAPDANADFIIGVSGDSMEPDYHDGEKLYVKKTEYIGYGEVGVFTINNECFLKEYGEDGLVSRNKKYDNIKGSEDVRLIGKVVGKVDE